MPLVFLFDAKPYKVQVLSAHLLQEALKGGRGLRNQLSYFFMDFDEIW